MEEQQEQTPKPKKPPRRPLVWADLLRLLGLFLLWWVFIQVAYFWRSNTALWFGLNRFSFGVFSGLFSTDWSFSLTNSPPLVFLAALLFAGLNIVLGVLFCGAFDVYLRPRIKLALGFTIGIAVSGIVFELITMAGLLYLPVAWLSWYVLIALAGAVILMRKKRPVLRWWRKPSPGSEGWVPFLDEKGFRVRQFITASIPRREELYPLSGIERIFWYTGLILIVMMSLAIFWHAVFFPEAYWDSLILYLGYARMTFLEHAFPFKATAQVGIGLGANYPHMFSTYGAVASTMFGGWSDLYQRLAAPLAGTLAVVLIYDTALLAWGRRGVAMGAALLFRSVPLGIAYSTYASDYAFAILFTAAFIYLAALFARTRLPGVFFLLTLIPAAAMHLNYLMGILWVPWAVAVIASVQTYKKKRVEDEEFIDEEPELLLISRYFEPEVEDDDNAFLESEKLDMELQAADRTGIKPLFLSRFFWITLLVCIALGSTWYVRNWVKTGNPVYAFFPEIFTDSVRMNPDVLASADIEWFLNGDGIGRLAEEYVDLEQGRPPRPQDPETFERRAGLGERLKASWLFWQGFETFRVGKEEELTRGSWIDRIYWLHQIYQREPVLDPGEKHNLWGAELRILNWSHFYKMAPLTIGFLLPGLIIGLLILCFSRTAFFASAQPHDGRVFKTTFLVSVTMVVSLLGYHYVLADYYLYQIIPIIVPMAFAGAVPLVVWRSDEFRLEKVIEILGYLLLIAVALVPGLAMSLMNFKIPGGGVAYAREYNSLRLDVFRHPGMDPSIFYRVRYGADANTWDYVNQFAKGTSILTHENRHLVFDPTIEIVHLDDWDIQLTYDMNSPEEKMRFFHDRGLEYYLRVANERNHPILRKIRLDELIDLGYLSPVIQDGDNILYEFNYERLPADQ